MWHNLNDFQFGVRASGGVEAILHSTNMVLRKSHKDGSLDILMVILYNDFNMVDQSSLLCEVMTRCLSISLWVDFLYAWVMSLYLEGGHIMSTTRVQ